MSLEALIIAYGYPLLFVGALLEGETAAILGGFLAHRGYLSLPGVILVMFLATLAADQFFFVLGRSRGKAFLEQRPAWQPNVAKVSRLLERYGSLIVIGFRFLYGLRTVTPIVIGMSGFSQERFIVLNTIGALVWAVVMVLAGYMFGHAFELILADIKKYELWVILGLVLAGGAVWLYQFRIRKQMGR